MLASIPRQRVPSVEVADPASRNDEFLALLPRITRHVRIQFRQLRGDEHDEAVAEVTANAFVAYFRLTGRADGPWPAGARWRPSPSPTPVSAARSAAV